MDKRTRLHKALRVHAVVPGEAKHVEIAGYEIAVFNLDGVFFATDDICTHMRARLSDGFVEDDVVQCPLHFGTFDIRSGKARSAPCTEDLQTYPARIEGDWVMVELPN